MATDADDATTALIARMLAEDQAAAYGADQYGLYGEDDSGDSDWGKGGRKKKQKGGGARAAPVPKEPKPRRQPKPKKEDGNGEDQEYTASGRRKRKDAGTARTKARPWTEDEERLFHEALELHGRDWKSAAAHVGTRDHRAFTSHAQKHFIKLCLQGKRLPPKVAESGEGYTLSGKPLDPTSAAARAYGFKPDSMQKLLAEAMELPGLATAAAGGAEPEICAEGGQPAAEEGAEADNTATADCRTRQAGEGGNQDAAGVAAAREGGAPALRGRKGAAGQEKPGKENVDIAESLPAERTEYAKSRPQRRTAGIATYKRQTSESLELQQLCDFSGPVASGATGSQPFSVDVSSAAMLVMDFHAHLSTHEVIGLLGGVWDPAAKAITIKEAFPCRRAFGSDSKTSVELDPEHEVETRAVMEQRGLVPVGWYHSHPTFAPKPSSKDNSNQHSYQALFRDEASGLEPFVGVIMGPYDIMLPDAISATTVFFVQEKSQGLLPYKIRHTVTPMELPDEVAMEKLQQATDMFKEDIGRVDFTELWRPFTTIEGGLVPSGGPMTKLAKLRHALGAHLPSGQHQAAEELLDTCAKGIERCWRLDLGYGCHK